jgi:SAM-dependent methyltransferase
MSGSFGRDYSAAYDLLYAEKDYDAECELLERIFQSSGRLVKTVLDLGCGTGAHAVRLAQRGYSVTGVDASAEMLQAARDRVAATGSADVDLVQGDVRTFRSGRTFDAVVCMFAVLGYQTTDQDVEQALATVRRHLAPGGPFVFDVWYGPAVQATGPESRSRVIETTDGELERQASAVLDPDNHVCTVTYRLTVRRKGRPDGLTDEVHRMRYFFTDELKTFLRDAGMSLVSLKPFPEMTGAPSEVSWNVLATVRG